MQASSKCFTPIMPLRSVPGRSQGRPWESLLEGRIASLAMKPFLKDESKLIQGLSEETSKTDVVISAYQEMIQYLSSASTIARAAGSEFSQLQSSQNPPTTLNELVAHFQWDNLLMAIVSHGQAR